eukprot:360051-Chlamydomonas_euryale.AAC.1
MCSTGHRQGRSATSIPIAGICLSESGRPQLRRAGLVVVVKSCWGGGSGSAAREASSWVGRGSRGCWVGRGGRGCWVGRAGTARTAGGVRCRGTHTRMGVERVPSRGAGLQRLPTRASRHRQQLQSAATNCPRQLRPQTAPDSRGHKRPATAAATNGPYSRGRLSMAAQAGLALLGWPPRGGGCARVRAATFARSHPQHQQFTPAVHTCNTSSESPVNRSDSSVAAATLGAGCEEAAAPAAAPAGGASCATRGGSSVSASTASATLIAVPPLAAAAAAAAASLATSGSHVTVTIHAPSACTAKSACGTAQPPRSCRRDGPARWLRARAPQLPSVSPSSSLSLSASGGELGGSCRSTTSSSSSEAHAAVGATGMQPQVWRTAHVSPAPEMRGVEARAGGLSGGQFPPGRTCRRPFVA